MEVAILEKINSYRQCFSERLSHLSSELELLEKERECFFTELETTVESQIQQMEASHQKALRELESRHDREINDQQTLAMKMSMFREYDKQISQLQRELDYANKRLAKLSNGNCNESEQSEPPTPVPASIAPETTKATSETKASVKEPTPEPVEAQADEPVHTHVDMPVRSEAPAQLETSETVAVPTPAPVDAQVTASTSVVKRRKVIWKKVPYYLDPETHEVFTEATGGEAVGRKEDKKIVLF